MNNRQLWWFTWRISIPAVAGAQCLPPDDPCGLQSCHADVLLRTAVQGSLASGAGLQPVRIESAWQRPLFSISHQLLHHRLVWSNWFKFVSCLHTLIVSDRLGLLERCQAWPEEALEKVAESYIQQIDIDQATKKMVVDNCKYFHTVAR